MRLAWLTDIHLNFLDDAERRRFLKVVSDQADAVAISGDIGESHDITAYLREMDEFVEKPTYFVLGNHDFYRGSISKTRLKVAEVAQESKHLSYLTASGVIELTPRTAIIGHDGCSDTQLGDYDNSDVVLSDHLLIEEVARWYKEGVLDKAGLRSTLLALSEEAANYVGRALQEAVGDYAHVILVTHVPPFREAAWYQGKTSSDEYLPYFASKAMGDVLLDVMHENSQSNLLVLCGHTHGGGEVHVLDNLRVLTGEAEYGDPAIQQVLEID